MASKHFSHTNISHAIGELLKDYIDQSTQFNFKETTINGTQVIQAVNSLRQQFSHQKQILSESKVPEVNRGKSEEFKPIENNLREKTRFLNNTIGGLYEFGEYGEKTSYTFPAGAYVNLNGVKLNISGLKIECYGGKLGESFKVCK